MNFSTFFRILDIQLIYTPGYFVPTADIFLVDQFRYPFKNIALYYITLHYKPSSEVPPCHTKPCYDVDTSSYTSKASLFP
jgi:hypothetical protein